jgi:hypothetical protein
VGERSARRVAEHIARAGSEVALRARRLKPIVSKKLVSGLADSFALSALFASIASIDQGDA